MSGKQTPQQLTAADPMHSVWVSASAGTGKTRVLVNRMLRLMLDGSAPEKLLCITYTKAAAAEVLDRIQESVVEWSYLPDEKLIQSLNDLLERIPTKQERKRARTLLPTILQSPGGMRIMTVHSFCQSVLAQFPLEANVPPGFDVCDDNQSELLLRQAKHLLLERTTAETDPLLFESLRHFFENVNENDQNGLIQSVLNKRYRLRPIILRHDTDYIAIQDDIYKALGVTKDMKVDTLISQFMSEIDHKQLVSIRDLLRTETRKTPHSTADLIDQFLASKTLDDYTNIFLNKESNGIRTERKNTFKFLENLPSSVLNGLQNHADRLNDLLSAIKQIALAEDSFSLLHICLHILSLYQKLKHDQNMMDFEDQILKTIDLLNQPYGSAWVHYKLDSGIDHILVDEAQDTSPAQWEIIQKLTEEFFAGDAVKDHATRTLFIVGDEKQSIYSFQNADPAAFSASRAHFATQWGNAGHDVSLTHNFRSASLILDFTDQVFSSPEYARHISHTEETIKHLAFHTQSPAQINIWPLFDPAQSEFESAPSRLASSIADHVQTLLNDTSITHNGRPLQPGNIMILVRSRNPMVSPLTKAFKDREIPVTSADRLTLNEHLSVQDCMAGIQSCLNPSDDYSAACFLKSPFIGITEDDLFNLCRSRGTESLFRNFLNKTDTSTATYIRRLQDMVAFKTPAEVIHFLLTQPCPADARSGRHALITRLGYDCDDILNILLQTAYEYETENHDGCQGFLTWIQNENRVIKRENGDADNRHVQIMTVHASKGLQAPIVFLADAHSRPQNYKRQRNVIWPDNMDGFLWSARKAHDSLHFDQEKDIFIEQQFSEYYRLLYVALTRAQQRLVICGHIKRDTFKDRPSWYELCTQAVKNIDNSLYQQEEYEDGALSLEQKGTKPTKAHTIPATPSAGPIPELFFKNVPPSEQRARPLRPSQPPGTEAAAFNPLQPVRKNPYKRGQILHNLFYLVPNYPIDQQENMLRQLIRFYVDDENEHQPLYDEVMTVLRHNDFAHLFTPKARAEVPIVGEVVLDGKPYALSGQIDRILVEDDRVLIVDFKTNRPPVLDADLIPEAYRFQMRAYRLLLEKIYPNRRIETALLWTAVPYLLPVSG